MSTCKGHYRIVESNGHTIVLGVGGGDCGPGWQWDMAWINGRWEAHGRDLDGSPNAIVYIRYAGERSPDRALEGLGQVPAPTLIHVLFKSVTGADNKDHASGLSVRVFLADGKTAFAEALNVDKSDQDYTNYDNNSSHAFSVPIIASVAKSQCAGFELAIGMQANGNDKWEVDELELDLTFSDGSILSRQAMSIVLRSNNSLYTEERFSGDMP